jgi:hypothetical protein
VIQNLAFAAADLMRTAPRYALAFGRGTLIVSCNIADSDWACANSMQSKLKVRKGR